MLCMTRTRGGPRLARLTTPLRSPCLCQALCCGSPGCAPAASTASWPTDTAGRRTRPLPSPPSCSPRCTTRPSAAPPPRSACSTPGSAPRDRRGAPGTRRSGRARPPAGGGHGGGAGRCAQDGGGAGPGCGRPLGLPRRRCSPAAPSAEAPRERAAGRRQRLSAASGFVPLFRLHPPSLNVPLVGVIRAQR